MQKYLKLLTIFLIVEPRWTAGLKSSEDIRATIEANEEEIRKLQDEFGDEAKYLNFDEAISSTKNHISSLELQLSQCQAQIEKQTNTTLSNILRGIQNIQSTSDDNVIKLKQRDDTIASLKAQMADNLKLLDIQTNEAIKASKQIQDLQSTITSYKSVIDKNNATITRLELEINQTKLKATTPQSRPTCSPHTNKHHQENVKLKSQVNQLNSKIKDLNNELTKCKLNNTNFAKLSDENFKKYQGDQQRILVTCQMDLESHRNYSTKKDAVIQSWKKTAEDNLKSFEQCQNSKEFIQKTEKNRQAIEEQLYKCQLNNTNLVKWNDESVKKSTSDLQILELCQKDLKSQRTQSTNKDVTIQDCRRKVEDNYKLLDQYQKNNELFKKAEQEKDSINRNLNICLSNKANINEQYKAAEQKLIDSQAELTKCTSLKDQIQENLRYRSNELSECKKQQKIASIPPKKNLPNSCLDLTADTHEIQVANEYTFYVKCNGYGGIIIHQRFDGGEDFNRQWQEYVDGFGNFNREFFLGLEKLHLITSSTGHKLHVSITYQWGQIAAEYDDFRIGNSQSFYELESIGNYVGHSYYNGLKLNLNQKFTTYDRNHISMSSKNCAENGMGGWWYPKNCGQTNLNAPFINEIKWNYKYGNVKSVVMTILPYYNGY